MSETENKEDDNRTSDEGHIKSSENQKTVGKIYLKKPQELESSSKNPNKDVQRAIEGLKEIPDEELQDFLDDKEFMEELDVLDAWEGDEEKNWDNEQTATGSTKQKKKRSSREQHHPESKGSSSREKTKREERKREDIRRDPSKSMKDIEKDKIKARNTQNKLLAEKEKAIKHLLDSDNVVPPGTEAEAIQSIKEEQNKERFQREVRNRDRHRSIDRHIDRYDKLSPQRRRTPERYRLTPSRRRSPFKLSPDRRSGERYRSPFRYSPNRWKLSPRSFHERRTPVISPDRRRSPRRSSRERRSSVDRKWSVERHRRRADVLERRRSRSRDRWSRSTDRMRSRSRDRRSRSADRPRRRSSRSPMSRRYSPRRRSRTRTRSPEKRARKRSPFLNELRRQLKEEAMMPSDANSSVYAPKMEGRVPLLSNSSVFKEDPMSQPSVMPSSYMHQPGHQPPPPPPSSVPPMSAGPPFMNFEPMSGVPPMNFEPMPPHPLPQMAAPIIEYSSGPVLYNQQTAAPTQPPIPPVGVGSSMLSASLPTPQPVPAPVMDRAQMPYNASHEASSARRSPSRQFEPSNTPMSHSTASMSQSYAEHGPSRNEFCAPRMERMKTPEPPIISKPKQSEKTSLSSLLEASVSAKDPSNIPVLYPGFKPEIMRHCEQALCQLPFEDPRLKMKGRFFYSRDEENETRVKDDTEDHMSNSILLQKSKTKIYWEENNTEQMPVPKTTAQTHQKICQTDTVETEAKSVQVSVSKVDFEMQVYPHDLQPIKEEKRSIMDRLDWGSQREAYEYAPSSRFREVEDLRHSLSNSSQRRSWNRPASPRRSEEHEQRRLDPADDASRNYRLDSPVRNRESFPSHKTREHYIHTARTPEYHARSMDDDFHERRSEHSRGESPMELESEDEFLEEHTFQRGGSDWHGRVTRGKGHMQRGKHVGGRPYRSFRGKF